MPGLAALCAWTLLAGATLGPASLDAQDPPVTEPRPAQEDGDWNTPRALQLVEQARVERQSLVVDSALHSYRAQARGYVYFFMDRTDQDLRSLIKADQIALDVLWQAPNLTKQRIVGLRDRKLLPTNVRYHLDHLTVVQDDFGDFIRMGDGDEVAAVVHPAGPGSERLYDFQLADSLTLQLPEGQVRVFELEVRPKSFERPGFIGSMFVDQATGAIVRMAFSFTPASYVDPYVDYIRVSLDNSLWLGRHWLPYRQEVEIRRELPLLDFMAGSIIRGRFEVRDYEFNVDFPPLTFAGRRVTSLSIAEREAFPFERGLLDDLEEEGLAPTPSLQDVQTQVREVVEDRYLTGLAPLRFHLATLADAFRYNRAEGLFLGAGATVRPAPSLSVRGSAGYQFGRDQPQGSLTFRTPVAWPVLPELSLYWNALRDIGGHPGAPPLENTITSLSGEKDYLDPYFARGAALTLHRAGDLQGPALTLRWERHLEARNVVSDDPATTDYRPVRGIDAGTLASIELTLPSPAPFGGNGELTLGGGRLEASNFATVEGEVHWPFDLPREAGFGRVSAAAGWVSDGAPAQSLYLLGGRMTLPGHPYRDFAGDRYWLVSGETTVPVYSPWVGIRFIGALGATYLDDRALPARWEGTDSDGVRASLGAGLSIAWDVMRLDLARGLGSGGSWEAVFSVSPSLRPWL